jgi:hypothetical protein
MTQFTHQLENLERWARANEQREREASARFWGCTPWRW